MDWNVNEIKKIGDKYIASYCCSKRLENGGFGQVSGDLKIELDDSSYKTLTKEKAIELVKTAIKTSPKDGSVVESNLTNVEDTVTRLANESVANNKKVPWE